MGLSHLSDQEEASSGDQTQTMALLSHSCCANETNQQFFGENIYKLLQAVG